MYCLYHFINIINNYIINQSPFVPLIPLKRNQSTTLLQVTLIPCLLKLTLRLLIVLQYRYPIVNCPFYLEQFSYQIISLPNQIMVILKCTIRWIRSITIISLILTITNHLIQQSHYTLWIHPHSLQPLLHPLDTIPLYPFRPSKFNKPYTLDITITYIQVHPYITCSSLLLRVFQQLQCFQWIHI